MQSCVGHHPTWSTLPLYKTVAKGGFMPRMLFSHVPQLFYRLSNKAGELCQWEPCMFHNGANAVLQFRINESCIII
jgi:hypothetical protein